MSDIYIALGTNQGERGAMLAKARKKLEERVGPLVCCSSVYETAAWGMTNQPDFFNQVVAVHSGEPPRQLMELLLGIEQDMGRIRNRRWGPRTIDLDLLFYQDQIIDEPGLTLPHPRLHLRRFVLVPLAELAPDFRHPVLHKTIDQLLAECKDDTRVDLVEGA